jgi:hypothetical protein
MVNIIKDANGFDADYAMILLQKATEFFSGIRCLADEIAFFPQMKRIHTGLFSICGLFMGPSSITLFCTGSFLVSHQVHTRSARKGPS